MSSKSPIDEPKPIEPAAKRANDAMRANLDFEHETDRANATRGLVADVPNGGVVTTGGGSVVLR